MSVNAKTAAMVLGIIFVIVGALGFVANPIVGPNGIFVTNPMHNWVHIGSGIVLLLGAYSPLGAGLALRVVGIIYAIVAVLGFVMPGDMMLGMIAMNAADRWLHVALAIVILYAGFGLPDTRVTATA
jgi:membrane protein YdbS with pleckstrin-like domain